MQVTTPAEGDLGHQMPAAEFIAMALGIVAALALGILTLIFPGDRKGYDRKTDLRRED